MIRNFNESKGVVTYLYNRYGKLHGQSRADEIEIRNAMIEDHTLEQLKMMHLRIEKSICLERDTFSLKILSLSIFTVFFSAIVTLFVSLISLFSGELASAVNLFKDKIDEKQFIKLFDINPIFIPIKKDVIIFFILLLLFWIFLYWFSLRNGTRRYSALILVEEAMSEHIENKKTLEMKIKMNEES